jgi:serine/threonine protein kinase
MTERYEIIKLIGKDPAGGMYLAEDTTLERKVVFRHIDSTGDEPQQKSWVEEFSVFSGKLCALQHPNLLTIYDVAIDEGGVSMVTQFVEGESLAERLEQGPLHQMGVYRMASDLIEALHAAHESGIFHGALHTGSVKRLPRATGGHRYLVVDLGLNKLATMVKGKDVHIADPVLLAPELHDGKNEPDVRADLFMLGQLCYTALAGGHPFAEESPEYCVAAHMAGELPPLSEFAPDVQADFADWVMDLASGEPNQRPESVKEAMTSLHAITIDEPLPNVAGETNAVVATPSVPTTAQVVVSVDQEVVIPPVDSGKKSRMRVVTIISVLILLIGIVLWLGLKRGGESASGAATSSEYPAVPEGVWVHLHDTEIVNTMKNGDTPVGVDLDREKTLDWTVVTDAPALSKRKEKDGARYIQSILVSGAFKEFDMDKNPVSYTAAGEDVIPKAATDSKKAHNAKQGEGWQTILSIPKKHKGPVIVTFYMIQSHCDFDIEVSAPRQDKPMKLKVTHGEPGVVKIPLEITGPKVGEFYTIKILAASKDPKEGFSMGINGIHVGSR